VYPELFIQKSQCTGCTACLNNCQNEAISMEEDEEGFLYPKINQIKCINCKKCETVCQIKRMADIAQNSDFKQKLYAAKNKNITTRTKSSSGGIFSLLAEEVLKMNGVIFGAIFDENFNVFHSIASNNIEYNKMIGSKYVDSKLLNVYIKAQEHLNLNRIVLFTGTPCQIVGLKCFLKKDFDKLLTCDLICHGANSPLIYKEWLKSLQNNKNIKNINFRDKKKGWHNSKISINYKSKTISNTNTEIYSSLYWSHLILRPSCYYCRYANSNRQSDITLGDFWGIEEIFPQFDDDKGTSCVIINSTKGDKIFSDIYNKIDRMKYDYQSYISFQHALYKPAFLPPERNKFWKDYYSKGYKYSSQKYVGKQIFWRFMRCIKRLCKIK
jgi:coenzyme F420-reducing hydrogenase beta subunit